LIHFLSIFRGFSTDGGEGGRHHIHGLLFTYHFSVFVKLGLNSKNLRNMLVLVCFAEVGGSATCSAMRISATCATGKIAADVRFDPHSADCGIALAH
jgi:hypothetical protein